MCVCVCVPAEQKVNKRPVGTITLPPQAAARQANRDVTADTHVNMILRHTDGSQTVPSGTAAIGKLTRLLPTNTVCQWRPSLRP